MSGGSVAFSWVLNGLKCFCLQCFLKLENMNIYTCLFPSFRLSRPSRDLSAFVSSLIVSFLRYTFISCLFSCLFSSPLLVVPSLQRRRLISYCPFTLNIGFVLTKVILMGSVPPGFFNATSHHSSSDQHRKSVILEPCTGMASHCLSSGFLQVSFTIPHASSFLLLRVRLPVVTSLPVLWC